MDPYDQSKDILELFENSTQGQFQDIFCLTIWVHIYVYFKTTPLANALPGETEVNFGSITNWKRDGVQGGSFNLDIYMDPYDKSNDILKLFEEVNPGTISG